MTWAEGVRPGKDMHAGKWVHPGHQTVREETLAGGRGVRRKLISSVCPRFSEWKAGEDSASLAAGPPTSGEWLVGRLRWGGGGRVGEGGLHAQTQVPGTGGNTGADNKTSLGHVTGYTVQTKSLHLMVGRHPGLPGGVQGQNGSEAGRWQMSP